VRLWLLCVLGMAGCASGVVDRTLTLDPMTVRYTETPGAEMGPALERLTLRLAEVGYTVERAELSWYGLNNIQQRVIVLNGAISVNAQFETLAHEAGHIFHAPGLHQVAYPAAEIFAELVGSGVQEFYGSKTATQTSSDYLARFKHAMVFVPMMQRDIDRAIRVLTGKAQWPPLPTFDIK
jgi:hypothetical protein